MKFFEPELGHLFFGSAWGKYELPKFVEGLLLLIFDEIERVYWNIYQEEWSEEDGLDMWGIKIRPYCWDGDEEDRKKANFEFENVKIYWYKYFGRDMSTNVEMSAEEWVDWFNRCYESIG